MIMFLRRSAVESGVLGDHFYTHATRQIPRNFECGRTKLPKEIYALLNTMNERMDSTTSG